MEDGRIVRASFGSEIEEIKRDAEVGDGVFAGKSVSGLWVYSTSAVWTVYVGESDL